MKIIKIIITFCLLLTLNGCGLHLRGMGSADSDKIHYKSVQIVGNRNSTLYQMLYTKINAIGVKIVDKPADDTLILIIGATNFTQKTVSVDSRSQDVEYRDTKPQKKLSAFTRSLLNKTEQVLASSHESEMLREEMLQHTADDIYIQFLRQK